MTTGLILTKKRNKKQDTILPANQPSINEKPVDPDEQIAHLFNEILKVDEQKNEDKVSLEDEEEKKRKKYVRIARARAILEE